jgi:hypothetical protein
VAASLLLGISCRAPALRPSSKVIYLVPENFSGWVCVDFEIKGAHPLPREQGAVVIRAAGDTIPQTSDDDDRVAFAYPVEAFVEAGGTRRPLPDDVAVRTMILRSGPNQPTTRTCRFIGTVDQEDAAGDPPGFKDSTAGLPVAAAERAALLALFEATGGPQWTHRVGWMGPPGTECRWHGVECSRDDDGQAKVVWLTLTDNNLRGVLPDALRGLDKLESLNLYGNRLTGQLPDTLVQRWSSGELSLIGQEASWLTDVSEIRFESNATGSIGTWRRIVLSADGRAKMFTERLRERTPSDRDTYCEVKDGQIFADDFVKLAQFIDRSGYDTLQSEYHRAITHATLETTSVTRRGKTRTVSDYASAGPLPLWAMHQAIAGVADSARWEKVTTQPRCPAPIER